MALIFLTSLLSCETRVFPFLFGSRKALFIRSCASSMAAKMTHRASSSSPSSSRWKYEVFLSFHGRDTRKNFTDHLFTDLVNSGIHTFRDNEELERGEDISSKLMDAIENSKIVIDVFSENYASSTWCLDELVKILDCKKSGQIVLPIFYKLDPSDVRHQKNSFAKALQIHEKGLKEKSEKGETLKETTAKVFKRNEKHFMNEMGKVETWKAALTEAANLSGWDQLHFADGHVTKLVGKVVGEVLTRLNKTPMQVATYPIGLDPHIKSISCLLNDRLDVVRMVGIHGLGGIGKTTIAKAIFNDMFRKFDGSSFLANVREVSSEKNGLVQLQAQLLYDVLKAEKLNISNEDRGIIIIKERLWFKKVLIVLDDVDKTNQIDKLVGEHAWFGLGSRIIITTRDEHLLNRPEVDEKYKVNTMDNNESLQLFCYHAFRQNHPLVGYGKLSNDMVNYARGLPLALVTLGSLLLDKRSQVEWESELEKLKKIPNGEILEILELSYDALDDFTRNIFLDISCYSFGKEDAITFLDACGLCPIAGIRLLIERSLLTSVEDNKFQMHDLIQDMGREIVRKQSPRNLGNRSRLWLNEDALDVLTNLTGTDAVECLEVDLSSKNLRLTTKAFFKMPNLRLLRIVHAQRYIDWEISDDQGIFLFGKLVWLRWYGFPFEYIPNNFQLGNLVILEIDQCKKLQQVWKGSKSLPKLKILDISHSDYLTCTPDVSGLPNLEKLRLFHCRGLVEVHESIHRLSKLVHLTLMGCTNLSNLPSGISELASLEQLEIGGCKKLQKLPEGIGNLTRLTNFQVAGTPIEESIELLKNLTIFRYSTPRGRNRNPKSIPLLSVSLYGFRSLNLLQLGCNLTDDDIPDDLWKLCQLKSLDLSGNDFHSLPSNICQLSSQFEILKLNDCKSLQSLPMLPSSLVSLSASNCISLEILPNLSNLKHLRTLNFFGCSKLNKIEGLGGLESGEKITLLDCDNLENNRIIQEISKEFRNLEICEIQLCGNEIPEWFDVQSESSSSPSCQVTLQHNMEIKGVIICIVLPSSQKMLSNEVVVHNQSTNLIWNRYGDCRWSDQIWVINIPSRAWKLFTTCGDVIKFSVKDTSAVESCGVKKIGVHVFYTSSHEKLSDEGNSEATPST